MTNESAPNLTPDPFKRQLTLATFGLLFVVLIIHLLEKFATILKPLFIAVFIGYVVYPVHRWLVQRGVRPRLAFGMIFVVLLGIFLGVGQAVYDSITSFTPEKVLVYRNRIESFADKTTALVHPSEPTLARERVRRFVESTGLPAQDAIGAVQGIAGSFFGFLTFALVVSVYLVFLMAEKITFPRRLGLAFGEGQASQILDVVGRINEAIVQYVAVKAWISFLTAAMSLVVFLAFGVEFAMVWGILIFLLNFIPYLGSLVALAPPIALAFLQLESPWLGLAVTVLLIGVQLFTGQYLEPRLAGRRLNLSPLLILLALAFWGNLWGLAGMVLAVPLTVVCKIVLDSIRETKPVGALMSNV